MIEDDDRGALVREKEVLNFPALEIATVGKVDFLPVVWVAPVEAPVETEVATAVEMVLEPVAPVEDFVPEDVKQRLIYHWLRFGPAWASDIVMQAPPPQVEINPLQFTSAPDPSRYPRQRVIGHLDDGVARAIRVRE